MDALIINAAEQMDRMRARFLRQTMSVAGLRSVFLSRSSRSAVLFAIMTLGALTTSTLFPIWVLILGPMLYGFPHLFATLRYVPEAFTDASGARPKTADKKKIFTAFTTLFAILSVLRILSASEFEGAFKSWHLLSSLSNQLGSISNPSLIEIAGVGLVFVTLTAWLRPSPRRFIQAAVILGALTYATFTIPLWTAGVLLLGHNFVAFIYWIATARNSKDRRVALAAGLTFSLITAAIFAGAFDGLYHFFTPAAEVTWAGLDYASIGKSIAPWSENYQLWFHAVVAYAFGQSLHYFVWMKAIPDQLHQSEVPASFRQSYAGLKRDFGKSYVLIMGLTVLAGVLAWGFVQYPQARILYFSVAAFHGYFEIAGIAFVGRAR